MPRRAWRSMPAGIVQVEDWFAGAAKFHALVARGKETGSPQAIVECLEVSFAAADHDDVGGHVGVVATEPVAKPRAHARFSGLLLAGVDEGDGRVVVDGLGVHRFDDGDVIDDAGGVREEFADPSAVLTVSFELEHRRDAGERFLLAGHPGEALPLADALGQLRAVEFPHRRVVVEGVDVRGPAGEEQVDHPLGFWAKLGKFSGPAWLLCR